LKITSLALTIILLIAAGCSQPDGAVGSGIGTDSNGTARVISAQVEADTSFIAESAGSGASPHLYVGNAAEITSTALISFSVKDMPPFWSITSVIARLKLSYEGSIGDGRGLEIDLKLSDFIWDESDPPDWDSLYLVPFGPAFESIVVNDDSGKVDVLLPSQRVLDWIRANDSSEVDTSEVDSLTPSPLTVMISAGDLVGPHDQLVRFRSRGAISDTLNPVRPELVLQFSLIDSSGLAVLDTELVSLSASKDAYILQNEWIDTGGNLIVGSGVNIRTNLKFDLSDIWQAQEDFHIVINRATIMLHKVPDADQTLPILPSLLPFKLIDELGFTFPDSAGEAAYVFVPTAIDSASDTLQIIVTNPTVDWVQGSELNFGVSLHSSTQGLDINRSAYYSSSHVDSALRPSLSVYYTEVPR